LVVTVFAVAVLIKVLLLGTSVVQITEDTGDSKHTPSISSADDTGMYAPEDIEIVWDEVAFDHGILDHVDWCDAFSLKQTHRIDESIAVVISDNIKDAEDADYASLLLCVADDYYFLHVIGSGGTILPEGCSSLEDGFYRISLAEGANARSTYIVRLDDDQPVLMFGMAGIPCVKKLPDGSTRLISSSGTPYSTFLFWIDPVQDSYRTCCINVLLECDLVYYDAEKEILQAKRSILTPESEVLEFHIDYEVSIIRRITQ